MEKGYMIYFTYYYEFWKIIFEYFISHLHVKR